MLSLQSLDSKRREWKALHALSLTLTLVNKFTLLRTLAILWKNLAFLSSSFNQISLDFYLIMFLPLKPTLCTLFKATLLVFTSSVERGETLSLESQKQI